MPGIIEKIKRDHLIDLQKQLAAQLAEAFNQSRLAFDESQKPVLAGRIADIEHKLRQVERELAQLPGAVPGNEGRQEPTDQAAGLLYNNMIDQDLLEIDFKRVRREIDAFVGRPAGGAALFVMEKSKRMGGPLCAEILRGSLARIQRGMSPRRVTIAEGTQTNEFGLLKLLADEFGLEYPAHGEWDLDETSAALVQKIHKSVTSGTVVLIEVRKCDLLTPHERVISWLLQGFWQPLVAGLPQIQLRCRPVWFVLLLSAEGVLGPACLPPFLKTDSRDDAFQHGKIRSFALSRWTGEDISTWLGRFLQLDAPTVDSMTRDYLRLYGGEPYLLIPELQQQYANHLKKGNYGDQR